MQIDLEAYGGDIDYNKLQGLWRLVFTTALDVVRHDISLLSCILHDGSARLLHTWHLLLKLSGMHAS